ncbi:MAG: hypothetical protein RLY86_118 [Pseudomonadota bacterium]|jgi:TP901 family phage tail tape measure protein
MSDLKLRILLGAVDRATSPLKAVRNAAGGLRQPLGEAAAGLQKLEAQSKALTRFRAVGQEAMAKTRALAAAQAKVQALAREMAAATGPTDKLQQQLAKARQEVSRAAAAKERASAELRKMRGQLTAAGVKTGDLAGEQRRLKQEIAAATAAAERQAAAMKRAADMRAAGQANVARREELGGQVTEAAALALSLAAPIAAAVQLESAQVRLGTVIMATAKQGETAAQAHARAMVEAREAAIQFSRSGLASTNQVLDIQYALNSAGIEASVSAAAAGMVAKVATVTAGAPEAVGEVMATVFNNMGKQFAGTSEERMQRIADLLTKTQFQYQIRDFGQLGESMKTATPALIGNNIALEQGLALLGALNTAGIQGSEAGTALSATLAQLSKASKEFGFDLVRTADGQLDVTATMQAMSDAIGGFSGTMEQDLRDKLREVFGDEGIKAVMLLGQNIGGLATAQRDLANSSRGVVDNSYESFVASSAGQMQILRNRVVNVGAALGTILLPPLNILVSGLAAVADRAMWLSQTFPGLTTFAVTAAAGLIALKVAAVALGYGWTFAVGGALLLRHAQQLLTGAAIKARVATVAGTAATHAGTVATVAKTAALRGQALWQSTSTASIAAWTTATWASVKATLVAARAWVTAAGGGLLALPGRIAAATAALWASTASARANTMAMLVNARAALFSGAAWKAGAIGGLRLLGSGLMVLPRLFLLVGAAARAMSLALLTNPVGLIVAGIATAAILIFRYWQPLKAFFGGLWDGLTAGLAPLKTSLAPLAPIGAAIAGAFRWVGSVFSDLLTPVSMTGEELSGVAAAGMAVGQGIAWAVNLALTPLRLLLDLVGVVWSAFDGMMGQIGRVIGWVRESWNGVFGGEEGPPMPPPPVVTNDNPLPDPKTGAQKAEAGPLAPPPVVTNDDPLPDPKTGTQKAEAGPLAPPPVGTSDNPLPDPKTGAQKAEAGPLAPPPVVTNDNPLPDPKTGTQTGEARPLPTQTVLTRDKLLPPIGIETPSNTNAVSAPPLVVVQVPDPANSPAAAAAAQAADPVEHHSTYQITIHAAPGMTAQEIAREVTRQLDERERRAASAGRSAHYDRG